ncbi:hypothetical protein [Streptomyces sp. NPDC047097]|uniref:hypothetical protein n=1 Tax=Streptomyces sp. NPDC047097 TaxID=3155260 RepID=UPI00340CA697
MVDGNGGALDVTATTVATTETGVTLIGAGNMTATPKSLRTGARTAFASKLSNTVDVGLSMSGSAGR